MFASVFVKHLQYCLIYNIYTYVYIQAEGTPYFEALACTLDTAPKKSQDAEWLPLFVPLYRYKVRALQLICSTFRYIWLLHASSSICFAHVAMLHPLTIFQGKKQLETLEGNEEAAHLPWISAVSRGGETPGVLAVEHEVECVHDSVVVVQNMFNCVKRHI